MTYFQQRKFGIQEALIGSMLILFGTVLLLHQLDIVYLDQFGVHSIWHLWPFIIVIIGIGKLADAPSLYHIGKGVWLMFLGTWLYVSIYHVYGLSFSETWPALLIAWGVGMMWKSMTKHTKYFYKEETYGKQ